MSTFVRAMSALVLTGYLLVASGCERENPAPPDGGPRPDAQVADAGTDAGEPEDAGEQPDADSPDGGCISDPDCWSCPPTLGEHFLNACTDSTCEPFPVTTARLPRLRADGTVPPLP